METKSQIDLRRRQLKTTTHIQWDTKEHNKKKDNQKESIRKWQRQWEEKTKGVSTKEIFPSVEIRLLVNLNTCPNMTNNYDRPWKYSILLASIKIIGYPECPCKHGTQTVD